MRGMFRSCKRHWIAATICHGARLNAETPCALGNSSGVDVGEHLIVLYPGFPAVTPGYSQRTTPWFSNAGGRVSCEN